jgi:hypothetical protein
MYIAKKPVKVSIAVYTIQAITTWQTGLKYGDQIAVSWSASANTGLDTLIQTR